MSEQSCIPTRRSTWPTYDPPPTARFLGSLTNPSIPELLAAQLDVEVGGPYEYGALLKLARSPDLKQELKQRLTSGIDALTDRLSSALEKFDSGVRARNPRQLQDKFMQEGAGLLAYGDLNTFFGGLEAIVGAPLPRVREAMAAEHTQQADSLIEFTTKNYGVTTTSATEWAFVVEPSSRPDDAWPVETKPVQERRRPMPIAELERRVDERGVQLSEQGDPVLTLEEAFGARLYTGPLHCKYNAVLRGLLAARPDSPVLDLRCDMVRLCCSAEDAALHAKAADEAKAKRLAEKPSFDEQDQSSKHNAKPPPPTAPGAHDAGIDYGEIATEIAADNMAAHIAAVDEEALRGYTHDAYEAAVQRINKYTTTLHAINSAIIKLSKLTKASTVYRGLHDFVLPDQFRKPNKYGVRGGIDSAFMSATLLRKEAINYAANGTTAPLLFEIQQGMIDRGADISFLSQYPFEKEILFNPLTGLEVRGSRVEGQVVIVEMKLSFNLTSLTIEQVIGKRKKVLQDMVFGLEAEVRQALRTEGLATYGTEKVLGEFRKDVEEQELGHPSEWYNDDERLAEALQGMLQAKRQYGKGGRRRTQALGALTPEELKRCGFDPKAYTHEVVEAVKKLEDSDAAHIQKIRALTTIGKLKPATLAQHGTTLVAKLEDPHAGVRKAVVVTLGKLEPATLAQHSAALVAKLKDPSVDVRQAVVAMLGKLEPATLAQLHGAQLDSMRDHADAGLRKAVVQIFKKLGRW